MLADAIRHYHDLLTYDMAAASHDKLADQQRRKGLFFGLRPLCNSLRPRMLTADQFRFLQERVAVLLRVFAKTQKAAIADAAFRKQFSLLDWEEELVGVESGLDCDYPTSRLDAFFVSEQELKFTEFNAETPAAPAYCDALVDVFNGLPVVGEFSRKYALRPVPTRPGVLRALLESYWRWSGRRFASPRIAILDWKEVPTYSEFVLFRDYFQSNGIECVIADPREVDYRGGRLWADGQAVDLIYKRVLLSELIERGGMDQPTVQAVRDGAVCMVNSARSKMLYKKASFAVVGDERNAHLFTGEEQHAIAEHLPWTRFVEDRKTQFEGRTVDLLEFIAGNRTRLVLKPNDEYGGKGIVLGWKATDEQWGIAIRTALATPYVVQDRVRLPSESFPSIVDGELAFADRLVDTNPYAVHGAYMDGCLTRISTEDLVNVTAGGGSTVPTFIVEER